MEKPKDLATLGALASGFTVTVLTNDTLLGSIATDLTYQALKYSVSTPYLAKISQLIGAISQFVKICQLILIKLKDL